MLLFGSGHPARSLPEDELELEARGWFSAIKDGFQGISALKRFVALINPGSADMDGFAVRTIARRRKRERRGVMVVDMEM